MRTVKIMSALTSVPVKQDLLVMEKLVTVRWLSITIRIEKFYVLLLLLGSVTSILTVRIMWDLISVPVKLDMLLMGRRVLVR